MDMSSIRALLPALLCGVMAMSGCGWLYTDAPLGEPVELYVPAEWNGAWLSVRPAEQTIDWLRVSPERSSLEVFESSKDREVSNVFACPQMSDGKFFLLVNMNSWGRRHGKFYLRTYRKWMGPDSGNYVYGVVNTIAAKDGDAVIQTYFSRPAVTAMVRAGELPGEVQPDESVVLRGLHKEHLDKLFATVSLENVEVAVRLPRSLDPCRGTLTEGN